MLASVVSKMHACCTSGLHLSVCHVFDWQSITDNCTCLLLCVCLQVWKSTTQLGCGMSPCGGRPLYVCNYSPPGNYVNDVRNNVFPPSS
jgi:hypothetical protein